MGKKPILNLIQSKLKTFDRNVLGTDRSTRVVLHLHGILRIANHWKERCLLRACWLQPYSPSRLCMNVWIRLAALAAEALALMAAACFMARIYSMNTALNKFHA